MFWSARPLFFLTKTRFTPKMSVGIRIYSNCFGSLLPEGEVLLELIVQRDQIVHNAVVLTVKGLGMPQTARVAAGKRYERGLTGEAGHGVPGVLLPSQTRSALKNHWRGRTLNPGSNPSAYSLRGLAKAEPLHLCQQSLTGLRQRCASNTSCCARFRRLH